MFSGNNNNISVESIICKKNSVVEETYGFAT